VGAAPTFIGRAAKVLIELNRRHPPSLLGMHDIYEPADPPQRHEIPIYRASDRIGSPLVTVDPSKIVGVVETDLDDECGSFSPPTPGTEQIGQNVAEFLVAEMRAGRIPKGFCRCNRASAMSPTACWARSGACRRFRLRNVHRGAAGFGGRPARKRRCRFASTCSLTLTRRSYGAASSTT
jgi:propionyl-CoA:succinyl-CoA transferase